MKSNKKVIWLIIACAFIGFGIGNLMLAPAIHNSDYYYFNSGVRALYRFAAVMGPMALVLGCMCFLIYFVMRKRSNQVDTLKRDTTNTSMVHCPQCGLVITNDDATCPNCGADLHRKSGIDVRSAIAYAEHNGTRTVIGIPFQNDMVAVQNDFQDYLIKQGFTQTSYENGEVLWEKQIALGAASYFIKYDFIEGNILLSGFIKEYGTEMNLEGFVDVTSKKIVTRHLQCLKEIAMKHSS